MIEDESCSKCAAPLGTGVRWSVCIETGKCVWESPGSMPIAYIQNAYCLGQFCNELHAMETVNDYLMQVGADALWSDVRPIETCACCKNDFDTTVSHKVLALHIERGPLHAIEMLEVEYVARFCPKCVPETDQ